jgi:hypothetical protein
VTHRVEFATHAGPRDTRAVLEQGRAWIRRHGNGGRKSVAELRRELDVAATEIRRRDLDAALRRVSSHRASHASSSARGPLARAIAIHEAGHAVVGMEFGHGVRRLQLRTDVSGAVEGGRYTPADHRDGLPAEVWLAGEEATRLALRHLPDEFSAGDRRHARECSEDLPRARRDARIILHRRWDAVLAIADALMASGEMLGAEVDRVYSESGARRAAA